MRQGLWVEEVAGSALKPLTELRNDYYGYWMVVTDSETRNGIDTARVHSFGTDRERLLDIWNELCLKSEEPTVEFLCNKKSNWMGGVFVAKTEG